MRVYVLSRFSCVRLFATLWTGAWWARILEWVAIPFSRVPFWTRCWTHVSYVSCTGRQIPHYYCRLGSPCNCKNNRFYSPIFLWIDVWVVYSFCLYEESFCEQSCLCLSINIFIVFISLGLITRSGVARLRCMLNFLRVKLFSKVVLPCYTLISKVCSNCSTSLSTVGGVNV